MISFKGRRLLLTGAAGAIGGEIARLFASLGATLHLSDRDASGLASLAAELEAAGAAVRVHACDTTDPRAVDTAATAAAEDAGLDAVVLAAGIYRPAEVAAMRDDQWREMLDVNLNGAFYWARAVARRMNAGGAIVGLCSIAGHRGTHGFAHYAATKGGLLAFLRSLAVELAPDVRVNAVSPGPIESPMVQPLMERRGAQVLAQIPLGRLGEPAEVARVVAFLASDWASYVTGETIHVNGGLYMG